MISLVDLYCRHEIVSNYKYQGILGNSLGLATFAWPNFSAKSTEPHFDSATL